MSNELNDRNFDGLSEKFARKVYGGLKGEIRLAVIWRDLTAAIPELEAGQPLRILDIGGGLGQFTVRLAELGHTVVYNDLSAEMLDAAQSLAKQQAVEDLISWHQGPYQKLGELGKFDLVLCHAVVEWLAEPSKLIDRLSSYISDTGLLSLTFYNHNGLVYRNLIRGNFKLLDSDFRAHPGSLTPGTPLVPDLVGQWLAQSQLRLRASSGVRVFHDYVTTLRGGHEDPASVIAMELKHSVLEPYKWLGRYIHFIAGTKKGSD
jgi:S-adenosylmethionine-dependent methyltransferase